MIDDMMNDFGLSTTDTIISVQDSSTMLCCDVFETESMKR